MPKTPQGDGNLADTAGTKATRARAFMPKTPQGDGNTTVS